VLCIVPPAAPTLRHFEGENIMADLVSLLKGLISGVTDQQLAQLAKLIESGVSPEQALKQLGLENRVPLQTLKKLVEDRAKQIAEAAARAARASRVVRDEVNKDLLAKLKAKRGQRLIDQALKKGGKKAGSTFLKGAIGLAVGGGLLGLIVTLVNALSTARDIKDTIDVVRGTDQGPGDGTAGPGAVGGVATSAGSATAGTAPSQPSIAGDLTLDLASSSSDPPTDAAYKPYWTIDKDAGTASYQYQGVTANYFWTVPQRIPQGGDATVKIRGEATAVKGNRMNAMIAVSAVNLTVGPEIAMVNKTAEGEQSAGGSLDVTVADSSGAGEATVKVDVGYTFRFSYVYRRAR
jgi:hypothetical protein